MNFNLLAVDLNVADIIVLAVLLIFTILGLVRGFTNIFVGFVGRILSLIFAFVLCASCARLMNRLFGLTDALSRGIGNLLGKLFDDEILSTTLAEFKADNSLASTISLPHIIVNLLLKLVDSGVDGGVTVGDALAPAFAYYVAAVIGFIVCYLLLRIFFFLIGRGLKKVIEKIKIAKALDRILGLALGIIQGFIVCFVVLSIIDVLPFSFLNSVKQAIAAAPFASFVGGFNIFGMLLGGLNPIDYVINAIGK